MIYFFGKRSEPCSDCADGYCTMNCGPCIPQQGGAVRKETAAERRAWTAAITGEKQAAPSKYGNKRKGKYASTHEAEVAANLRALETIGKISNLREQVDVVLVEGRDGVSGVTWRADFVFDEHGETQWCDAKGWDRKKQKWITTPEFRLKERLAFLLRGITIRKL